MNAALSRFMREVRHLFHISILNMVFAALAIAYGVSYIVTAILGQDAGISSPALRVVLGVVAFVSVGLGISWLRSITRVVTGITAIRRDLHSLGDTPDEERATCLIVRMLAHYRENRTTIRTMILVCTAGGWAFFLLGIVNSLEILTISGTGGEFRLDAVRLIAPTVISLGIALVSLLSSHYFNQFSRTWNQRLQEIDESEFTLKKSLGLGEA